MRRRTKRFTKGNIALLVFILILFGMSTWSLCGLHGKPIWQDGGMHLGLDLQGGAHLIYEADKAEVEKYGTDKALKLLKERIQERIDSLGVYEPVIQTMKREGGYYVMVQLPGIPEEKMDEAKALIEERAFLEFREVKAKKIPDEGDLPVLDPDGEPITELFWVPATDTGKEDGDELTGYYLTNATATLLTPEQQHRAGYNTLNIVSLDWDAEGGRIFEAITGRINAKDYPNRPPYGWGNQLGIFLDGELKSAPVVQEKISAGGGAVISNIATWDEATRLEMLLRIGYLPVHLTFDTGREVSATLGAEFIDRSIWAGAIGMFLVMLFMLLYYRFAGLIAIIALLIYAALTLTVYKVIPVTLTLPGIGGFILSIGMAVDANVLIFERLKEELRRGRPLSAAVDAGFSRAWPSIRDSNLTTMIVCGILYWFGSSIVTSPMVMGFALTLVIGIAISMFTAVVATRVLLRLTAGEWATGRPTIFGVEERKDVV